MQRAIPDALVTGHAALIPKSIPAGSKRSACAGSAITAAADSIITFNLRDFPVAVLADHGIEALHPDAFMKSFIAAMPQHVLTAVRECITRLVSPVTADSYLATMRHLGLTDTAAFLDSNRIHWQR